jgi:TonB family protein
MPQFPGGPAALFEFLSKNIQYPKDAEKAKLQGRVIVTFVVKKDGSIADAKVVKSVAPSLDAEALRVINAMPNWTPGKQGGQPVNVKYTVPLTFRVEGGIKGADNPLVQKTTAYLAGYYAGKNGLPPTPKTLILVDGKEVSYDELEKIKGESIDHMDVLKDKSAIEKYGEKAKGGVILITTKKNTKQ